MFGCENEMRIYKNHFVQNQTPGYLQTHALCVSSVPVLLQMLPCVVGYDRDADVQAHGIMESGAK